MSIEEIKLIIVFVLLLGTAGGSAYITHKVDNAQLEKIELGYAQAQEKAVEAALNTQKQLMEVATQVALEDSQKQRTIANQTRSQLNVVQKYVSNTCVTWGHIRVYQSTILGISPDSVPVPTGKSDKSCSGVTASQLATSFINNIGIAKANAQQLNSLIEFYQKSQVVLKGSPKK